MNIYQKIIDGYIIKYQDEEKKLSTIYSQTKNNNEKSLIDRKNYEGHFTASAFVVLEQTKKMLMIHHKILKLYLQPGGHIDILDKSPLDAAKRELFEETGIESCCLEYKCIDSYNELVPFNISVHIIPENIKKHEDVHYHYDLQYLFFCNKKPDINIDMDEINSYKWVKWGNFKDMSGFEDICGKIEKAFMTTL